MEKKRRKRHCSIFLEHLPNELFAQIFSYLNGVDAVFAFSQLNHRFQCLLSENCQFFDYKSIRYFDRIQRSLVHLSSLNSLEIYQKEKGTLLPNGQPDENFNRSEVINLIIYSEFVSIQWIHILTKLRHLEIHSYAIISSENVLCLLKNTPHLCSLIAEKSVLQKATEYWNNVSICNHLARKIVSLKLRGEKVRSRSISKNEIQQIIRIFSSKCQHLSLYAQSPTDTIGLILQNMSQLHSLHVTILKKISPSIDMAWLQQQQSIFNSSNCIIVNNEPNHYFWLGQHQ
ncbi:unnamed protein product [Rotaria sp. Silwood2]|nr:unnamed protein product [Rotaria sp. Silwood2]CAF4363507.1 unnamed protein product [Rotaria sp. Silwood2]